MSENPSVSCSAGGVCSVLAIKAGVDARLPRCEEDAREQSKYEELRETFISQKTCSAVLWRVRHGSGGGGGRGGAGAGVVRD